MTHPPSGDMGVNGVPIPPRPQPRPEAHAVHVSMSPLLCLGWLVYVSRPIEGASDELYGVAPASYYIKARARLHDLDGPVAHHSHHA